MAERDPFPMQSEEARRLAASVENNNDDDHRDHTAWNKMGTSLSQRLPKVFKGSKDSTGSTNKESLVARKKKKKGKKKMRQIGNVEVPQKAFLQVLKLED